jgi:hypothetical protein
VNKKDVRAVKCDMAKLQKLTKRVLVPSYLGVLVCDNYLTLVDRQLELLKEALNHEVITAPGALHKDNHTGQWQWCFGCIPLRPPGDAPLS